MKVHMMPKSESEVLRGRNPPDCIFVLSGGGNAGACAPALPSAFAVTPPDPTKTEYRLKTSAADVVQSRRKEARRPGAWSVDTVELACTLQHLNL